MPVPAIYVGTCSYLHSRRPIFVHSCFRQSQLRSTVRPCVVTPWFALRKLRPTIAARVLVVWRNGNRSVSSPEPHRQPHAPDWSGNPATQEDEQAADHVRYGYTTVTRDKTQ